LQNCNKVDIDVVAFDGELMLSVSRDGFCRVS